LFNQMGARKYLNTAERKSFIKIANAEPDKLRRAFCQTLFYAGCRISEALNVTAQRVDLAGKAIIFETLKQRKGRVFRSVPIPDSLAELLSEIVAGIEPSTRIWKFHRATGYRLIKDKMDQACLTGGNSCPKGLRHGFAIACVGRGIPLTIVQRWLGHSRLETTSIYLNATGDEERELAQRLWLDD
jgi:integrase/recombinase XerD